MNTTSNYTKKIFLLGLLLVTLAGTVMAQGTDNPVVIKKNISRDGSDGSTHYLAHIENSPGVCVLQDVTDFDPATCLWYTGTKYNHTGKNHNYYFEDGTGALRYLSAPMAPNGTMSLSADKPAAYQLSNTGLDYYFYNWDGVGLARGHQVIGIANETACTAAGSEWDDDAGECWEVYWVEYDGSTWKLTSTQSYSMTTNAARAYDITFTEHPLEVTGTPTGGLTSLTASTTMTYPSSQTPTAEVSAYSYNYTPAYTSYSFNEITGESRPRPTATRTFNFWGGSNHGTDVPATASASSASATQYEWTLTGEGAQYLSFESGSDVTTSTSTSAPTIYYRTENTTGHKTATLTLTVTFGTGESAATMTKTVDIEVQTTCQNPAQAAAPTVGYEGATVTWNATATKYKVEWKKSSDNWTSASSAEVEGETSYTITGLDNNTAYDYRVTAFCNGAYLTAPVSATGSFTSKNVNSCLIYGAVFGGGRMADVNGKTEVIVINCDTIGAVYGGNDIAGSVVGANGSTITLGVNAGDANATAYNSGAISTKVVIGSVYGGGNGYYAYNGTSFVAADDENTSHSVAASGSVNAMTQQNSVGDAVWTNTGGEPVTLNIPAISKTDITVTNNAVKVDSLFGGAKNAFINNTSGDNTHIAINGGTIFSVFGGNNFGGTLGNGSNQHIELAGTKTNLTDAARGPQNTYTTGFGRDFGIRYLFGGGNKVAGRNVIINVTGGQADTVFGGGNAADVASVDLTVNCPMASGTAPTFGSTYSDAIESYSGAPTVKESPAYAWNGSGLYNVRTLFGGNNAADMNGLPTVTLTSGSVGTVYGGGNAGDMLASITDPGDITADFDGQLLGGVEQTIYYSTHVEMNSANMVVDYIYGGCQKSSVARSTWVEMKNGHAGTVFGGCNISGDVGSVPLNPAGSYPEKDQYVNGATYVLTSGGTVHGDVFAGSNGRYHCNDAVHYVEGINYTAYNYVGLTIPTHNETHVLLKNGITVKGNVYAGGNMAPVGFSSASRQGKYNTYVGFASVIMTGGTVNGDVYGGGKMASVYGSNDVQVSGGTIGGALYGGNDIAGQVAQVSNRKLPAEFGVASDGKTKLNALNVNTYVRVTGRPDINTVYGGGNGAYDYENMTGELCDITNKPIQTVTFVDIDIDGYETSAGANDGGHINNVYGGGNGVTVTGGITVLMNVKGSGGGAPEPYDHIDTIYGGNNMGDLAIVPDIILLNGQAKNVYGGCNAGAMTGGESFTSTCGETYNSVGSFVHLRATYTGAGSDVNQTCAGTVSGAVYGGCKMNGVTNNSLVLVEGGTHTASIYGGSDISGTIGNTSQVVLCGGTVGSAFGGGNGDYYYDGNNVYDKDNHSIRVASSDATVSAPSCTDSRVDIVGGNASNVYGSGNAAGSGTATINMTAGSVSTGIYGGCNSQGTVTGDVTVDILGGTVGTDADHPASGIFGGGYGASTLTNGNITVNIGASNTNDGATIYSDIYGGSALGTVNDAYADLTTVNILSGSVTGNIYGGGLGAANLDGNGYVTSTITEAVVNGTVHVNIGADGMTGSGPTIHGKVFGCNNLAGTPKGNVYVDVYKTAHTASPDNRYPNPVPTTVDDANFPQAAYAIDEVYGGGNLAFYEPTEGSAFTHVHIHNCDNTIEYVYGGGNAAQTPKNDVVIDGGRMYYVFAGGNGAGAGNPGADVEGDATLTVNGGIIDACFGGSNTLGTIGGTSTINLTDGNSCARLIKEVFGGGNQAATGSIEINIPCGTEGLYDVYGASNDANVNGNVTLNIWGGVMNNVYGGLKGDPDGTAKTISGDVTVNIYGGNMNSVFGGCNVKGVIQGKITVNVNVDTTLCPNEQRIVNVYGGGNQAAYTAPTTGTYTGLYPEVNIIHGTIENDVFGGGLGATAVVTGNPVVTVGKPTTVIPAANQTTAIPDPSPNTYWSTVGNNVYGGGNAAQVSGNTKVLIINKTIVDGNVYGGGNAAGVTGSTDVQIGD
jgi:hypothetical protein